MPGNSLRQGAPPPAHRASKFVRKCVQDLISQSKQKRPTINRNLRIYQNHPNMSDTPLGSLAGWEGARKTVFLGHHLRKRSEKEGTGAVHEKITKVCQNLVPQWEASGTDDTATNTATCSPPRFRAPAATLRLRPDKTLLIDRILGLRLAICEAPMSPSY